MRRHRRRLQKCHGDLRAKVATLVPYEEYIAGIARANDAVVPSQRDLHPPNIVKTPDATLVLVDWDAAGPVITREDVAKFAFVWATPEDGYPQHAAVHAFIDGYREGGGIYQSNGVADLA